MHVSWLALLTICGALILIVLIMALPLPRSQRKVSTPAERVSRSPIFRDDEQYWRGGTFYNNPDDPAVFVPRRFGLGWTVNFGNRRGRLFLFGMLLLPLVILILTLLISGPTPIGCHPSGCSPLP